MNDRQFNTVMITIVDSDLELQTFRVDTRIQNLVPIPWAGLCDFSTLSRDQIDAALNLYIYECRWASEFQTHFFQLSAADRIEIPEGKQPASSAFLRLISELDKLFTKPPKSSGVNREYSGFDLKYPILKDTTITFDIPFLERSHVSLRVSPVFVGMEVYQLIWTSPSNGKIWILAEFSEPHRILDWVYRQLASPKEAVITWEENHPSGNPELTTEQYGLAQACPFCKCAIHVEDNPDDHYRVQIICTNCNARGPWKNDYPEAIEYWNRMEVS